MNEPKQKVGYGNRISIGILVVAMGIIFVPMVFDSPRTSEVEIEPMPKDVSIPEGTTPNLVVDSARVEQAIEKVNALVDEFGYSRETGAPIGEPALIPDSAEAQQWAIQLGAFEDSAAAHELRIQIQDERYPAWVSRVKVDGDEEIRVYVGPFNGYEAAIAHRDQLAETLGISPLIVAFSI